MKTVTKESAMEFVNLYDSLLACSEKALRDAQTIRERKRAEGNHFEAVKWGRIIAELRKTHAKNQEKHRAYALIATDTDADLDNPLLKRQAE